MKSNKPKIISVTILILLGIGFLFSHNGGVDGDVSDAKKTTEEAQTIKFALADYDGNTVESKDFKGKIVVVNAWATWCPFCVNELPEFKELQEAFPDEVVVVAINRAEPLNTAKGFSDNLGLSDSYLFLVDPDDSFYKSIGGFSMPETIFLNAKGELVQHKRGPFEFPEMKSIVERILTQN